MLAREKRLADAAEGKILWTEYFRIVETRTCDPWYPKSWTLESWAQGTSVFDSRISKVRILEYRGHFWKAIG